MHSTPFCSILTDNYILTVKTNDDGYVHMKKKISFLYFLFILMGVILLLWIGTQFNNQFYSSEDLSGVKNAWVLGMKELPSEDALELNLSLTLPSEIKKGTSIAFYTRHKNLTVTLGGEEAYRLQSGQNTFGSTSGVTWNVIPLDSSDAGKTVLIHQHSVYRALADDVPVVYIGSIAEIYQQVILKNAIPFLICVFIVLCGLMFVSYWFVMRKRAGMDAQLLFLGTFSIMLGLWSVNETPIIPLLARRTLLPAYWSYMTLMLMVIPFVLFVKGLYRDKEHPVWYVLCSVSLLDIVICTGAQILNLADFRETLVVTHSTLIFMCIVILVMTLREIHNSKITKEMRINIIFTLVDVAGLMLDLITYYFKAGDSNVFGRICFLVYVIVLGIQSSRNSFELMQRGREIEIYQRLAFNDQLTGIYNRTAYARDMVEWQGKNLTAVGVFMLDLNDLKKCNDTLGHAEGDRYLISAVSVLEHCFKPYGRSYRIGGDEFCVIIPNMTEEIKEQAVEKLEQMILQYNQKDTHTLEMSIAWGCACFDKKLDRNLDSTVARADEEMYHKKMEMKGGNIR